MIKDVACLCCLCCLFMHGTVDAANPLGGLAVALSPSGQILACAGDNRVLYLVDPVSLHVKQRSWLGVDIVELKFNRHGNTLLLEDTDATLHLLDTADWRPIKKLSKAQQLTTTIKADLAAVLDPDYNGHRIRFLSMTDLAERGRIVLAKGEKVQALGYNSSGDRLAVLLEGVEDPSEAKGEKAPSDLKGLALEEFRLKTDGKTTMLKIFEAPGGAMLREHKLYYTASGGGCRLLVHGDKVLVVNYTNINAEIGANGEVALFRLENGHNYGIGFSSDHTILMAGGLADGTYTKVDGLMQTRFQPDRLAGWPEYFKSFAVAADGTAYGSTSGYRIIRITAGGSYDKSAPIF